MPSSCIVCVCVCVCVCVWLKLPCMVEVEDGVRADAVIVYCVCVCHSVCVCVCVCFDWNCRAWLRLRMDSMPRYAFEKWTLNVTCPDKPGFSSSSIMGTRFTGLVMVVFSTESVVHFKTVLSAYLLLRYVQRLVLYYFFRVPYNYKTLTCPPVTDWKVAAYPLCHRAQNATIFISWSRKSNVDLGSKPVFFWLT